MRTRFPDLSPRVPAPCPDAELALWPAWTTVPVDRLVGTVAIVDDSDPRLRVKGGA